MEGVEARERALLILHMRQVMIDGWVALGRHDLPGFMSARADFVAHSVHDLPEYAPRLNTAAWERWVDRYIGLPAIRHYRRTTGATPPNVTTIHPGDARDAPLRPVPAVVRVFPRKRG